MHIEGTFWIAMINRNIIVYLDFPPDANRVTIIINDIVISLISTFHKGFLK